jgi:ABC-type phosphate transport system ATPase subunit
MGHFTRILGIENGNRRKGNSMIVIVNGPCGVGKSTIAKELENMFEDCAHIKADDVHCFIVNSEIIPEHIRMTDINIESLVKNFRANGFSNIIIDNVYEKVEHLIQIKQRLSQYDSEIYSILLYCELSENIRRDMKRDLGDVCGAKRVRELHEIMYKEKELGITFDTTVLSKEKVAADIYNLLIKKD